MSYAHTERAHATAALLSVAPDAPTLCAGWTAHDLAAHLWLRENKLFSALGYFVPALEERTKTKVAELQQQLQYPELVELIRQGPPKLSLFALPGVDEAGNGVEYLVHGMDVRRANGLPEPERDDAFDEWAWKSLRAIAPRLLGKSPIGLVLEWDGRPDHTVRAAKGDRIVTVVGKPGELLLYAFGRREAADIRLAGRDADVAALTTPK